MKYEIGKRYEEEVTLTDWGPGQKLHTTNYGSEYEFTTKDGIKLYWDTKKIIDYVQGKKMKIRFTVTHIVPCSRLKVYISRVKIINENEA